MTFIPRRGFARSTGFSLAQPAIALVSRYTLDSTSGDLTSGDGPDGSLIGTPDTMGALTTGDANSAIYFDGNTYMTWATDPAHALPALTLSFYLQLRSFPATGNVQVFVVPGANGTTSGVGAMALFEILPGGAVRGYKYDQTGTINYWNNNNQSIPGLTLALDTPYRIDISLGPAGGQLWINGVEIATMEGTNTWDNGQTKYWCSWQTGLVAHPVCALDEIRLYSGQASASDIAGFDAAGSFASWPAEDPGASDIELTAIDAWAVDAASGGAIASSSGGTMPTVTIDYDPTPHVSGAAGNKSAWSAEFRNVTFGAWSRLGGGDFRFTPGSSAGVSTGEYRVSDDAGSTFSDWTPITIKVVARPPAPFYLVEDYSGVSGQKLQAAINDASSDGGGTVTTLTQPRPRPGVTPAAPWVAGNVTRSDGSNGYTWQENTHLLGLSMKQPDAQNNSSGAFCSVNGNGQCSDWTPGFFDDLMRGGTSWGASWGTALRHQAILCDWDGNANKMAYHSTSGDQPTPNSNCGTCCNPGGSSGDTFNLQQQSGLRLRGGSDGNEASQRKALFDSCMIRRTMGDGRNNVGGMDIIDIDMVYEDTGTRGGPNLIGGNSKQDMTRVIVRVGPDGWGAKVDHETETSGGSRNVDLTHTDCKLGPGLFDMIARSSTSGGSTYLIEGTEIGPGLNLLARLATNITVNFKGTTANPQGLIRYHVQGGGGGGTHPACRVGGWAGASPHICTYHFEDQIFEAFGDPYIFNTVVHTPGNELFEIRLGDTVDTGDAFRVEIVDCITRWHNQPMGATARLFRTTKQLTTTQVVRIDGLTIDAAFRQDVIVLDGQRLEYRNIVHQGFPGSTIQQLCPGAGQYVAL